MPDQSKPRRPSFGLEDALRPEDKDDDGLDLSGFTPRPRAERPSVEQIRKTSEAARFPSREATTAPSFVQDRPTPTPLVQLNTKIPPHIDADVRTVMQRTGWRKVDVIKRAITALREFSDIASAAGLDLEQTLLEAVERSRNAKRG